MTPDQVALVKDSFAHVAGISDKAADLFYDRLFTAAPDLRTLFPDDLTQQKLKLMAAIGMVVGSLEKLDTILETVQKLGRSHSAYGVRSQDYATVGAALLWTLKQGLGDKWTPEIAEAWTVAYGTLASAMVNAAAEDSAAA